MSYPYLDPPSPPGRLPEPERSSTWFPEIVVVGVAILLAVLVALVGLWGFARYMGPSSTELAGDPSPSTQTTGTTASSTTSIQPVDGVECPSGTDPVICDAVEFVELQRQRPFKKFPAVELLGDAAFNEDLLATFDPDDPELRSSEVAMRGLGIIGTDISLVETYEDLLGSGVLGFYNPEDERLVVRGKSFSLASQATLIHELVHAFDDQWFDLEREFDSEQDYAFLAIVEGNATRIEEAWVAQLTAEEQAQQEQEAREALSPEDSERILGLPDQFLELQLSPYIDGRTYLAVAAENEEDIDRLLSEPPESSERILHPDIDGQSDEIIEVESPSVDGTELVEEQLGELTLRVVFGEAAASGWDGDSYVAWESDARECVSFVVVFETVDDQQEFVAAADVWVQEGDRSVEPVAEQDRPAVSAQGCV